MMSAPGLGHINHMCSLEPVCGPAGQTDRQTERFLLGLIKPKTAKVVREEKKSAK